MPQASELGPDEVVFRLFREHFIPDGQKYPNGEAFIPSSIDQDDAKKRGIPVRVTVWDQALTTPSQAKFIWGYNQPVIVFKIRVRDVIQLRARIQRLSMAVVRDPLIATDKAGSEGHCGFEGLDRKKDEPRTKYKTLLDEVAQLCRESARV